MSEIIEKPKTLANIEVAYSTEEERQTIVHCIYDLTRNIWDSAARIWPSTILVCEHTGREFKFHHAEGISLFPDWTIMYGGKKNRFTLIFEPMPRDVKVFELYERIPEPRGWRVKGIKRNKSDVYTVTL